MIKGSFEFEMDIANLLKAFSALEIEVNNTFSILFTRLYIFRLKNSKLFQLKIHILIFMRFIQI